MATRGEEAQKVSKIGNVVFSIEEGARTSFCASSVKPALGCSPMFIRKRNAKINIVRVERIVISEIIRTISDFQLLMFYVREQIKIYRTLKLFIRFTKLVYK